MADAESSSISFDSKEWDKILKKLRKKWNDIENRKEFGGIISSFVFADIMSHFEKEKGPDGPWVEWSKSYKDHLNKIGRSGNKKLQFDGKLRQSFTPTNYRASSDGVLFFNNAKTKTGFPYAYAHDNDEEPRKKLPRRAFMWLSSQAINGIINATQKWLSED